MKNISHISAFIALVAFAAAFSCTTMGMGMSHMSCSATPLLQSLPPARLLESTAVFFIATLLYVVWQRMARKLQRDTELYADISFLKDRTLLQRPRDSMLESFREGILHTKIY